MSLITYRASLENYTTTGNILGIGRPVCNVCRERHLKGIDFGDTQQEAAKRSNYATLK